MILVADFYQVSLTSLKACRRGSINKPRQVAIYLCVMLCQQPLKEVAQEFGIKANGISKQYRKVIIEMNGDNILENEINQLVAPLNLAHFQI